MIKGAMIILALVGLMGCVPEPTAPAQTSGLALRDGGTWVVCEGLWRQNNSQLSYIMTDATYVDVVSAADATSRLGDTASDIVVKGDTIFVALNGSRAIDVFHRRTGRRISRIRIDERKEPYRLVMADDSTLYCTNLNDDSFTEIDARRLSVRLAGIPAGPAPEGIAATRTHVFVANSGLGDLRKGELDAGTIYVYRRSDMLRERTLTGLPNVAGVRIDAERNVCWVLYRHYTSARDSLGGVVAYSMPSFTEQRRIRYRAPSSMSIDPQTGRVYVLHAEGVDVIDGLNTRRLLDHAAESGSVWYALGFDGRSGTVWVGDAKNYVVPGDVLVFTADGHEVARHRVGINPSAFAFP
jgi:DNA-binding beta-propeller fold protein YncE